jgi:hypothetical protein
MEPESMYNRTLELLEMESFPKLKDYILNKPDQIRPYLCEFEKSYLEKNQTRDEYNATASVRGDLYYKERWFRYANAQFRLREDQLYNVLKQEYGQEWTDGMVFKIKN